MLGTLTVALLLVVTNLGRASAENTNPCLPALRLAAMADFYALLRAAAHDSLPEDSASVSAAGTKLSLLTEYLPDSIPLRTQANTVLIAHRKNPKYRASIERLLWRRLDPIFCTLDSPEELSPALTRAAIDLQPVCGTAADSVRLMLGDLYASSYPHFSTNLWAGREDEIDRWRRTIEEELEPHGAELLGDLARQLALTLPDTSRVRILVIAAPLPSGITGVVARDDRATLVVSCRASSGHTAIVALLCDYLLACDALAPPDSPSAVRLIAKEVKSRGDSRLERALPRALLQYATAKELTRRLGWKDREILPESETWLASFQKNWGAYSAGGISLSSACAAIASEAAGRED